MGRWETEAGSGLAVPGGRIFGLRGPCSKFPVRRLILGALRERCPLLESKGGRVDARLKVTYPGISRLIRGFAVQELDGFLIQLSKSNLTEQSSWKLPKQI